MAHKTYILDTSVVVHDPNCFKVFEDNTIVIPIAVLEELDKLKTRPDNVGSNARIAIRQLDEMSEKGNIAEGIETDKSITIKVDVTNKKDPGFDSGSKDDYILSCAIQYKDAILVTKDVNMRVRAKAYGITSQDYKNDKLSASSDLYQGYRDINLDEIETDWIWTDKPDYIPNVIGTPFECLYPNECVQVTANGKKNIYRRLPNDALQMIKLSGNIFSISSKNREQAYALELLLDPKIPLVTLIGQAGCGKTILSCAAGLHLITERTFSKLEIFRPIQPMGRDIGFIPGTVAEKLAPWMGAIYDAMEFLLGENYEAQLGQFKDKVRMEALTYIRGKSANNCFLLLDEAQNLTKNEMKTIITRVGHKSKIVCVGDIEQIDHTYLDATNNGLTYLVEAFKDSKLAGHVTLTKGERSELASTAARIL